MIRRVFGLALALGAIAPRAHAAEPSYTIRVATVAPRGSGWARAMALFESEIELATVRGADRDLGRRRRNRRLDWDLDRSEAHDRGATRSDEPARVVVVHEPTETRRLLHVAHEPLDLEMSLRELVRMRVQLAQRSIVGLADRAILLSARAGAG